MQILFFIASFLVSSSHETFVKENRWFWGGAIVEAVETDFGVIYVKTKQKQLTICEIDQKENQSKFTSDICKLRVVLRSRLIYHI